MRTYKTVDDGAPFDDATTTDGWLNKMAADGWVLVGPPTLLPRRGSDDAELLRYVFVKEPTVEVVAAPSQPYNYATDGW